ncbi:hypothetical protein [Achromobacter sp. ACM05]|uniref:hypothetical protein n=1 Tax=Achromobacter sp. ACM05 TaxID=2854776 RepID=UPI001C485692|nr:hypothetical protein [Achromobacter sp. ACM05]MBV7502066.1 hypothetical protein [Achromobacter sp. ACM05]
MEDREWLQSLTDGSEVLVTGTWVKPRIATVDRVTKTQIIVGGSRYSKETRQLIGADRWSRAQIQQVSDGFRESQNKALLKAKILDRLDSATTEELAQINVILTKEHS